MAVPADARHRKRRAPQAVGFRQALTRLGDAVFRRPQPGVPRHGVEECLGEGVFAACRFVGKSWEGDEERQDEEIKCACGAHASYWIPAFAGMTKGAAGMTIGGATGRGRT